MSLTDQSAENRDDRRAFVGVCLSASSTMLVLEAASASADALVAFAKESDYYAEMAASHFRAVAKEASKQADAIEQALAKAEDAQ